MNETSWWAVRSLIFRTSKLTFSKLSQPLSTCFWVPIKPIKVNRKQFCYKLLMKWVILRKYFERRIYHEKAFLPANRELNIYESVINFLRIETKCIRHVGRKFIGKRNRREMSLQERKKLSPISTEMKVLQFYLIALAKCMQTRRDCKMFYERARIDQKKWKRLSCLLKNSAETDFPLARLFRHHTLKVNASRVMRPR